MLRRVFPDHLITMLGAVCHAFSAPSAKETRAQGKTDNAPRA